MNSVPATPNTYPNQNFPLWSSAGRMIARTVFDAALKQELHEVIQEARRMANRISEPDEVWDLERFLSQRRKGNRRQLRLFFATDARV